jgi:hypothetical protein
MRKLMLLLGAGLCAMAFVVPLESAQAVTAIVRTWVSNNGSDSNPGTCTLVAPCASIAHALTETVAGGEIDCLTPGDYGNGFTITQSVTIDCGAGQVGAITGGGFSVAAGSGSVVIIRNLTINGDTTAGGAFDGTVGISVASVGTLVVENCHIIGFPNTPATGIAFTPNVSGDLVVTDTTIQNTGTTGGLSSGIYIQSTSGIEANVTVTRSQVQGNYFGIVGDGRQGGSISATISDSVVSGNAENGITVISAGSSVVFMIDQTKVTENAAAGLFAGGSGAGILARNTTVFKNGYGLDIVNGGALYSYGNNSVAGNATNGAFTGTAGLQ